MQMWNMLLINKYSKLWTLRILEIRNVISYYTVLNFHEIKVTLSIKTDKIWEMITQPKFRFNTRRKWVIEIANWRVYDIRTRKKPPDIVRDSERREECVAEIAMENSITRVDGVNRRREMNSRLEIDRFWLWMEERRMKMMKNWGVGTDCTKQRSSVVLVQSLLQAYALIE
jgi:hypothetical protein